jgi:kinesin family protein 5
VAYIEIYMERIRDLLDRFHTKVNLAVREDPNNGVYVSGVTEEYCTCERELLEIMKQGAANRATAATGMNEGSSRSHSVFMVTVKQRNLETTSQRSGKLFLVDLAGSEIVRKTNATGQQLEEAKTINKSLSALGLVINALTEDRPSHVPYRDSKLTRVLQVDGEHKI